MDNSAFQSDFQHTIKQAVTCEGIGLHSGKAVELEIIPAPVSAGITFIRTDLAQEIEFPASALTVGDTKLGTSLNHPSGETLSTVEHLMAALWGCGIDNARIYVDGPEIPIMDGSSEPFIKLIDEAGIKSQNAKRSNYKIETPMVMELDGCKIEILPYDGFAVEVAIDFEHEAIGKQNLLVDFSENSFSEAISNARTFGFLNEVEYLKTIGLARGGSLENAIVLNGNKVLNPEGLRSDDEFVQHKALDLVGDLFLCGGRIKGLVRAYKPGHSINTAMAAQIMKLAASSNNAKINKRGYKAPAHHAPMADSILPAFA